MITDLGFDLVLLIIGAVCFGLATLNVNLRGINLTALGLLAVVLTALI